MRTQSLISSLASKQRQQSAAFSLIEIMIGLAIIGLGASVMMPRLLRRSPVVEWPALQQELNNILYFARQEAITTQKVHRLVLHEKKKTITVEVIAGEEKPGVDRYIPAESNYFTSRYELPDSVRFGAVTLGKKNLFEENKGVAWCYIVPNGLIQQVSIQLLRDEGDGVQAKKFEAAPFLGTFDDTEDT